MAITYLHTNNASSTLAVGINAAVTSITVKVGHGTLFPNPGVNQAFYVTVEDRRLGKLEIMSCTARSGDVLTVVRGQQGTVPQAFAIGVNVSNRITAAILNDFVAATVAVVPIDQIPLIPDSKLITVNASRLFGTVPQSVLPVIPPEKLTSVPAASLTGTISTARLPMIPASLLPVIPPALLTSVPAASLTGTIHADRLPAIPASKLTSVPAGNLTGVIPSAALSGSYTAVDAMTGSSNATFPRFIASAVGSAAAPAFTWSGYGNTGTWYNAPTQEMVYTIGGVNRFRVGPTAITAQGGAKFTGDGSGLTNLNISLTPAINAVGCYAAMRNRQQQTRTPGEMVDGDDLYYSSFHSAHTGSPRPTGMWRCMGYCGPHNTDVNNPAWMDATTLFLKVSN